jgi:hypothetical protein
MNTHPNQSREALPPDEVMLEPAGQFATDLRNLRSAVQRAADRRTAQPVPFGWLNAAKRRHRSAQRRVVLAWSLVTVCAALLCIGALPFLHHATPPVTAQQVAPVQPVVIDDTALLEQVDSAVSESVPKSLAPLATLDDLGSTTSTNTESSLNAPEKKNVAQ